jgi:hypothetical protein
MLLAAYALRVSPDWSAHRPSLAESGRAAWRSGRRPDADSAGRFSDCHGAIAGYKGCVTPSHITTYDDNTITAIFHPLLALIASATNSQLAKYVEYPKEENKILRARLPLQSLKRTTGTAYGIPHLGCPDWQRPDSWSRAT